MKIQLGLIVVALATSLATVPADAAWRGFFNREVGFSFNAPSGLKAEKTNFTLPGGPARAATTFRIVEDNIEFKVTVVNFAGTTQEDAIKAASAAFQAGRKVLSHEEARVETNQGHKMSVELPNNGGRSMASIYFKNGHLIQLDATVLPANGDYGTPETARFVESIAFGDDRVDTDALELKLQK